ncbi:hypothetical protein [Nitratireductor soli]|uniref:hypothetical protein n=1 Tax=Nitratireductor soli TaxID=1670619 RepID=UPI000A9C9997|nr:hypothetical protein [Nitratireductor soli]
MPASIFSPLFSAAQRVKPGCPPSRACILLGAAMLSACMATNPHALHQLSRFDPFKADPRHVAIAVKTDRNLWLRRGDVELRIALAAGGKAEAFDETFVLAIADSAAGAGFSAPVEPGDHVLTAMVAPEDRARFETVQHRARAAKTANGKGTLGVTVRGGCRSGPLDTETLSVRSYMRTEAGGEFFPLTGEIGLQKMLGGKSLAGIPPCKDVRSKESRGSVSVKR